LELTSVTHAVNGQCVVFGIGEQMTQRKPEATPREQEENPSSPIGQRSERSGYDDEISLVDLWRILARRRWWLIGIAGAVSVLGALYALAQPTEYRFQTTIQLPTDENRVPVVTADELRSLVQELFIPMLEADMSDSDDELDQRLPETQLVEIESPRFVLLRSTTTRARHGSVEAMHEQLLELVQAEFADEVALIRQNIGDQLSQMQIEHANALRGLDARKAALAEAISTIRSEHGETLREFDAHQTALTESLVVTETQHADTLRDLDARQAAREREARDHQAELDTLEKQYELVEQQLEAIAPLREEFTAQAVTAAPGLVTFIQEPRTTLLNMQQHLERELTVEIPRAVTKHRTHLQRLTRELADGKAQREAIMQRQEIEITQMKRELRERETEREAIVTLQTIEIENLQRQLADAEAEYEATAQSQSIARASLEVLQNRISDATVSGAVAARAPRPAGPGPGMIMSLSLVLGGMLGVVGAFFREFLHNVNTATA